MQKVLQDLDDHFGHQLASSSNMDHLLISYSADEFPFIQGMYPKYLDNFDEAGPQTPVQSKAVMIAGDAFPVPRHHSGWVCAASLSGLHAAETLLSDAKPDIDWGSIPKSIWMKEGTDSTIFT